MNSLQVFLANHMREVAEPGPPGSAVMVRYIPRTVPAVSNQTGASVLTWINLAISVLNLAALLVYWGSR